MTRLVSGCVTVRELNFSHFVFSLTPASPRGSHVSPSQRYQQEQGKSERNNDQDRRRLRVLLRRPSLRCKIPTFHSAVAFPSRRALRADGFGIGSSTYSPPLRKRTPGPSPFSGAARLSLRRLWRRPSLPLAPRLDPIRSLTNSSNSRSNSSSVIASSWRNSYRMRRPATFDSKRSSMSTASAMNVSAPWRLTTLG